MTDTISVRELQHELPRVARAVKRGRRIKVLRYGKPLFLISPLPDESAHPTSTFADLLKIRFKSGDPHLSQKIDEIIYEA